MDSHHKLAARYLLFLGEAMNGRLIYAKRFRKASFGQPIFVKIFGKSHAGLICTLRICRQAKINAESALTA